MRLGLVYGLCNELFGGGETLSYGSENPQS